MSKGMSLLEILVVVAVFAILGVIVTRSVILSIGGSKKSESLVKVRENLNYSLGVIERQIRNANLISVCPNPDTKVINYQDQTGNSTSFSCLNVGTDNAYVASVTARLTSSEVTITSCSFTCTPATSVNPALVTISLEARDASASALQTSTVTSTTQIYLRNY